MSNRWVNAIYCEDIRNEVGGKTSLMGMFGSEMIVPVFPAIIPRLVAMVKLRAPSDDMPQLVKFIIYRDEEMIAESSIKATDLGLVEDGSEDRSGYVVCFFAFGALEFTGPTQIRLRAICDGEEITGNALMVRAATDAEARTFGFPRLEALGTSKPLERDSAAKPVARPARAKARKTLA